MIYKSIEEINRYIRKSTIRYLVEFPDLYARKEIYRFLTTMEIISVLPTENYLKKIEIYVNIDNYANESITIYIKKAAIDNLDPYFFYRNLTFTIVVLLENKSEISIYDFMNIKDDTYPIEEFFHITNLLEYI